MLLALGVMHLGNVFVLNRIRRRGLRAREQRPPVPLGLVPAGRSRARRLFPDLEHAATPTGWRRPPG
ncbi:hypothetical protein [Streptomyces sp. NPDC088785]|uniref:hypothetical protein n=1 Tax=Streptomyces sp. NPDC088785 TaxID=3365897 RepID=UPI0037FF15F8